MSMQADLTKLVGKLCDELQQKITVKVQLQNRIQKLKVRTLAFKEVVVMCPPRECIRNAFERAASLSTLIVVF